MVTTMSPAKWQNRSTNCLGCDKGGPKEPSIRQSAHWQQLANTTEQSHQSVVAMLTYVKLLTLPHSEQPITRLISTEAVMNTIQRTCQITSTCKPRECGLLLQMAVTCYVYWSQR